MSRLSKRGSFGELGPGDLEMLLLRLRMRKDEGRDRAVLRDPPGKPRGRNLRSALSVPMSVVRVL